MMKAEVRSKKAEAILAAARLPVKRARFVINHICWASVIAGDFKGRDPARAALARAHYLARKPVIASAHAAIVKQIDYAKHETLRNLGEASLPATAVKSADSGGVVGDILFDKKRFARGFLAAIRGESAQALQTAGDQFYAEIGKEDDPWELPPQEAQEFLDRRANLLADVPDEVFSEIKSELQEGLDAGESTRKLAARLSDKCDEIGEGRGMTVASTEVGSAYGFSRQAAMVKAGITHKAWLTSHLPTVRATHAEAEADGRNQRVPVDEPFEVGGEQLMYPGDEAGSPENIINCHCVALSLADEDDGIHSADNPAGSLGNKVRIIAAAFQEEYWQRQGGKFAGYTGPDKGGESGAHVHPLESRKPLTSDDAARLMLRHPNHPVSLAFKRYFSKGEKEVSDADGRLMDGMLRRVPPYQTDGLLYRGLSFKTREASHAAATDIRGAKPYVMGQWMNSGSKNPGIAAAFAARHGNGVVLAAVTVKSSARDMEPFAKALSPQWRHQEEISFLRGSKFRVTGERQVQLRTGSAPLFSLEEE